ncbi:glycosyltransferase [Plantactinospora sp. CA-290183]|uniref:glycosyltransferase n=1 Tax=Plantactinospora sp. CA-290183 TaxID=3240006 RepID=UPI003D922A1E
MTQHRTPTGRSRLVVVAFLALTAVALVQWREVPATVRWYGLAVFTLLSIKLMASVVARAYVATADGLRGLDRLYVATVVPVHNEDPKTFRRALEALLAQTRPPDAIVVVDDASESTACRDLARSYTEAFAAVGTELRVIRFDTNRGKRLGIAEVVRTFDQADVYLGVDSDTVLHPSAVRNGLMPFSDPRVRAVTGLVLALNAGSNLLTRLIDVRYANAFLYERSAYSSVGSVLCACGSLAFYHGPTLRTYLDDFLSQTFLGRPATYGDDRRLTNYCLTEGTVVLQPTALAWTLVPERLGHFIRQQTRWNKSFFRESIWVLANMRLRKPATWLAGIELTSWLVFTAVLLWALLVMPWIVGPGIWISYLTAICLLSYVRSIRYIDMPGPHGRSIRQRLVGFALSPLYGLLHVFLLLPLRFYSLATLRDNGWGTRNAVEVGEAPAEPVHAGAG